MKSSLGKLRKFALHKNDGGGNQDFLASAKLDELTEAAQDIEGMRNCYDSLLSAAAVTANCAYEFSESLREMGSCLLEKTALLHDAETCRVLLMLGKVQFELQKLVDNYRHHISLTITNPSESLLNELKTVEDMKRLCDEKRNVYEYMVTQHKEKGRSKSGKSSETFTSQQLQIARDEYNEEATLCVFRLKSLKQGQSRSLLTQAARHHAAQLNFFRKGLKSLEVVEPQVRLVTEKQHIDYQFSGLEEDYVEDGEASYDTNEDGELSFDYRANEKAADVSSTSRNEMEVDDESISLFPLSASKMENPEINKSQGEERERERRRSSFSAPIFPERKFDPAERAKEMLQTAARKSHTYVLPTPNDSKTSTMSSGPISSVSSHTRPANPNLWHSSPLVQKKPDKDPLDYIDKDSAAMVLPLPSLEGSLPPKRDASDGKKIKRKAVSGPLSAKQSSTKPVSGSAELPRSSPTRSPTASPPLVSSPRINELHELPRPPVSFTPTPRPSKSPGLVGHSAPLGLIRSQDPSSRHSVTAASPLPAPPSTVPRSFSIPSSSQRAMALQVSRLLESEKDTDFSSPPLTPIAFGNMNASSIIPSQSKQKRLNG